MIASLMLSRMSGGAKSKRPGVRLKSSEMFVSLPQSSSASHHCIGPCRTRERSKGTRLNITELEANTNDLHAEFEVTLAHLEQEAEAEEKDSELRAANEEIEHLEKQVYALEEDADRMAEEHKR
jgi:hypothetical protein